MKLASYIKAERASYGAVFDGGIVDLGFVMGDRYPDLKSLLGGGLEYLHFGFQETLAGFGVVHALAGVIHAVQQTSQRQIVNVPAEAHPPQRQLAIADPSTSAAALSHPSHSCFMSSSKMFVELTLDFPTT